MGTGETASRPARPARWSAEAPRPSAAERREANLILALACAPFLRMLKAEQALVPPEVLSDVASMTTATSQLSAGSADPRAEVRAAVEHRAPGERQICDHCSTTILCYYCACPHCGYEACMQCVDEWRSAGCKPACVRPWRS